MLVIVNKMILFWIFSLKVAVTTTRRLSILQSRMEKDGVENVWVKILSYATYLLDIFFIVIFCFFLHSHSRVFLGMIASDSRSWIVGMDFFSFPSRSRILGIDFFIPFPLLNFGNVFFYSLPVPEFREWFFSIPFPFPYFGNGIFHSCSCSQTPKCHSRLPLEYSQNVVRMAWECSQNVVRL